MQSTPQQQTGASKTDCNHINPICVCKITDSQRAELLGEYLDRLAEADWDDVLLMPLDDEGKAPAIADRFGLGDPRASELLHTSEGAIKAIQRGASGFALYAGRGEFGTDGLVFTDHDDTDSWHPNELPTSLLVMSGSGDGYHGTYRNGGNVKNAVGKGQLEGAGEIRASNWYIVLPGSIHPSGGVYHTVNSSEITPLHTEDLPCELRPGSVSSAAPEREGPASVTTNNIEALPEGFDPNEVTNQWDVPLRDIREISQKTDRLLTDFNPRGEYPSTSEADMATVAMLLIWGFSEHDIADILRATRTREKVQRDNYVWRTITRTALTKTNPLDPALGRALVESAKNNGGQPVVHEAPLMETKISLQLLAGEATVSKLVDEGAVDWRDAKRKSVMKRTRRTLQVLEEAGYVSQTDGGPVTIWRDEDLESLNLPHDV